jgi:hypothetical protein
VYLKLVSKLPYGEFVMLPAMAEIRPCIEAGAVFKVLPYGIYEGFVGSYVHIIKSLYNPFRAQYVRN